MPAEPIISTGIGDDRITAEGTSLAVHEWRGSGPATLHVHYRDDEAWHVLEGTLTFRFKDRSVEANAGTTVFVPAGIAHTFQAPPGARYLIVLTPRLNELIGELQGTPLDQHPAVFAKYDSEQLE